MASTPYLMQIAFNAINEYNDCKRKGQLHGQHDDQEPG